MANAKNKPVEVFLAVVAIAMLVMTSVLVFIVRAPWYVVVDELIGQAIYTAFLLLIYEPLHKRIVMQTKLSTTYIINSVMFLVSVCFFYAGYKVTTVKWLCVDWGIAVAVLALGLVFYYKVYGHEDVLAQKAEAKLWKKRQKMYAEKGMTEAEIFEDAKAFLEYHLVGDILEGNLDFERPFDAEGSTVKEMSEKLPTDPATVIAVEYVRDVVRKYTANIKGEN